MVGKFQERGRSFVSNYVRIPMTPHPLLNPNATLSRKQRERLPYPLNLRPMPVVKNALKRDYKEASTYAALSSLHRTMLTGPVILDVVVAYEKGRFIPDWDNAIPMLKGAIDGITIAGFMKNDNQVIGIFLRQIKDPDGQGYTDIIARQATDEEIARHQQSDI